MPTLRETNEPRTRANRPKTPPCRLCLTFLTCPSLTACSWIPPFLRPMVETFSNPGSAMAHVVAVSG
jgi:hypothetical protein